jgi:hypothetical protein
MFPDHRIMAMGKGQWNRDPMRESSPTIRSTGSTSDHRSSPNRGLFARSTSMLDGENSSSSSLSSLRCSTGKLQVWVVSIRAHRESLYGADRRGRVDLGSLANNPFIHCRMS